MSEQIIILNRWVGLINFIVGRLFPGAAVLTTSLPTKPKALDNRRHL